MIIGWPPDPFFTNKRQTSPWLSFFIVFVIVVVANDHPNRPLANDHKDGRPLANDHKDGRPLANDHKDGRPLANDHLGGPASCK